MWQSRSQSQATFHRSNLLAECMESSGVSSRMAATTLTPASVAASIAKACDAGVKELAFGVSGTYRRHGPTQKLINLCPLWLARKLRAWKLASERAASTHASRPAAGKAAAARMGHAPRALLQRSQKDRRRRPPASDFGVTRSTTNERAPPPINSAPPINSLQPCRSIEFAKSVFRNRTHRRALTNRPCPGLQS